MSGVRRLELEVELERIIFSEVRRKTAILKPVVEKAKAGAGHQLRADLVSYAQAWRKIGLLGTTEPLAIFVGNRQCDPILGKQTDKTRR
jgi:hypothetical protein